jgi:hypothetical protein
LSLVLSLLLRTRYQHALYLSDFENRRIKNRFARTVIFSLDRQGKRHEALYIKRIKRDPQVSIKNANSLLLIGKRIIGWKSSTKNGKKIA